MYLKSTEPFVVLRSSLLFYENVKIKNVHEQKCEWLKCFKNFILFLFEYLILKIKTLSLQKKVLHPPKIKWVLKICVFLYSCIYISLSPVIKITVNFHPFPSLLYFQSNQINEINFDFKHFIVPVKEFETNFSMEIEGFHITLHYLSQIGTHRFKKKNRHEFYFLLKRYYSKLNKRKVSHQEFN